MRDTVAVTIAVDLIYLKFIWNYKPKLFRHSEIITFTIHQLTFLSGEAFSIGAAVGTQNYLLSLSVSSHSEISPQTSQSNHTNNLRNSFILICLANKMKDIAFPL